MFYEIVSEESAQSLIQYLNEYDLRDYEGVSFEGRNLPTDYWVKMCLNEEVRDSMKELSASKLIHLAADTYEAGIKPSTLYAKKLLKQNKEEKIRDFIENYPTYGLTKCKKGTSHTKERLEELFREERRFRGRPPRILNEIAAACDYYDIPLEDAVSNFDIERVRTFLNLGVPKIETVLLYTKLSPRQQVAISSDIDLAQMVTSYLDKSYKNGKENLEAVALWIADHASTDRDFLKKVYKKASSLNINENTTIGSVESQLRSLKSSSHVAKLEKAYKKCGFKLKNCVCDLKKTTVSTDRYTACLLEGDDPKQVSLGYDTDCCQHLEEAGESAMMHGLLNPKAGFWVVTKNSTQKVVAQAEAWELDEDTLVFDNIEFSNDAEISQYKEIVGKWLANTPYKNVIMGSGYNEFLYEGRFENAGGVKPPVTPYELYVISYEPSAEIPDFWERTAPNKAQSDGDHNLLELESEEKAAQLLAEGRIDYFDYIYCDSENDSVYIKHNYEIADFFELNEEQKKQGALNILKGMSSNFTFGSKIAIDLLASPEGPSEPDLEEER